MPVHTHAFEAHQAVLSRYWSSVRTLPQRYPIAVIAGIMAAFFLFFSWSTLEYHEKLPREDWKNYLRADAAGYYSYLPGTFHHGMRASGISDELVERAGLGFIVDRERDRMLTKYTYGPALLMLPFYLVAEMIEGYGATDGWSPSHYRSIGIAGIFYLGLGSFFLLLSLRRWAGHTFGMALLTMALAVFGTNLFYYGFRFPAYSHIYSFFLVSLSLYAVLKDDAPRMTLGWRLIFMASTSLMVIIRPVDVIAVVGLVLLLWIRRSQELRSVGSFLLYGLVFIIFLLPQAFYWRSMYDHWIIYSYGDEGFTFWNDPRIKEVLFSPGNGLLWNAPIFILLPFGIMALWHHSRMAAMVIGVVMAIILYACASWHQWHFGCSYGQRSLVQYVPFLALTIQPLLYRLRLRRRDLFHALIPILLIASFINYRGMLNYGVCYFHGYHDPYDYQRNLLEAFMGSSYLRPEHPEGQ